MSANTPADPAEAPQKTSWLYGALAALGVSMALALGGVYFFRASLFYKAMRTENPAAVRALLAFDPDLANQILPNRCYPLAKAAMLDNEELASAIIKAGADPSKGGEEALKAAQYRKNAAMTRLLLDGNVEPGAQAVARALGAGDLDLAREMLEGGAPFPSDPDQLGKILASAASSASPQAPETIALLAQNGVDIHANDQAALISAIGAARPETVAFFIQSGADVTALPKGALLSPVHQSAKGSSPEAAEVVRLLVEAGADLPFTEDEWKKRAAVTVGADAGLVSAP
jgi:ankyrin repeat protein